MFKLIIITILLQIKNLLFKFLINSHNNNINNNNNTNNSNINNNNNKILLNKWLILKIF